MDGLAQVVNQAHQVSVEHLASVAGPALQVNRDTQVYLATQASLGLTERMAHLDTLASQDTRVSLVGQVPQALMDQMAHLVTQASVDGQALRAWGHRDTQASVDGQVRLVSVEHLVSVVTQE